MYVCIIYVYLILAVYFIRWLNAAHELEARLQQLEQQQRLWQEYDSQYDHANSVIDEKQKQVQSLAQKSKDVDTADLSQEAQVITVYRPFSSSQ